MTSLPIAYALVTAPFVLLLGVLHVVRWTQAKAIEARGELVREAT